MATFHFPELQGGGETYKQQRLGKRVLEARPRAVTGTPQEGGRGETGRRSRATSGQGGGAHCAISYPVFQSTNETHRSVNIYCDIACVRHTPG